MDLICKGEHGPITAHQDHFHLAQASTLHAFGTNNKDGYGQCIDIVSYSTQEIYELW